jgi:hypothetical protein
MYRLACNTARNFCYNLKLHYKWKKKSLLKSSHYIFWPTWPSSSVKFRFQGSWHAHLSPKTKSKANVWRKIWSWAPKGRPIPGRIGRLTVGHINSTQLSWTVCVCVCACVHARVRARACIYIYIYIYIHTHVCIARMGEKRNAYRLFVGKPEGMRPLGKPWRRSVDNIKMDLLEIGWGSVDWIGLAQDRDKLRALMNVVVKLRVS